MRLLLCSQCVRGEVAELTEMVGAGARAAVIANALDGSGEFRAQWLEVEVAALRRAGLEPFELDLRGATLPADLDGAAMVWGTGGSAFALIDALEGSGLGAILRERLADDSLAYGGTSAGACVCAPTLRGFELFDPVADDGRPPPAGLGLVSFSIVPHFGAGGGLGVDMARLAAFLAIRGMPYRTLRDGEALAVRGGQTRAIAV